jgi:hypothetical protein
MRGEKVKITTLALAITSVFSFSALAQTSSSAATQDDSMHCMEGMAMPGCPQTDKPHHQPTQTEPPQDVQPQQPRQQNDMNNMPGMQHEQRDMTGMQMSTPQQSQSPDTLATKTLQEPENPEHKTGSNLPAPELLKDVATRPAMALADFETLADANNPTLKQANAFVHRSQEQARQAGLYPNPSVGYQGEQIRGGSFGGGEQGGFVQQTVVLGGKLGLLLLLVVFEKLLKHLRLRLHQYAMPVMFGHEVPQGIIGQPIVGPDLDKEEIRPLWRYFGEQEIQQVNRRY